MRIKKSTKVLLSKIITVLVIVGFMFANTTLPVAAITAYQEYKAQQKDNGGLPYDKKAFDLMQRLSEYDSFTEEEKLYIQNYLGTALAITQAEEAKLAAQAELLKNVPLYYAAIRIMLEKGSFTLCDDEEKGKVLAVLECLDEQEIAALTKGGLSMLDIYYVNLVLREGYFSVEEAVNITLLYPEFAERSKQLFNFSYSMKNREGSVLREAAELFAGGKSALEVRQALALEVDPFIRVSVAERARKAEEEKQGAPSRNNPPDPEELVNDPIAPFSMLNGSDERVDLNSGNLSYTHNILNLPGVNGLGVNLSLV